MPERQKVRHVIVGNSGAAISAVRAIRQLDQESTITLIGAEDCPAYSPVLLTYYIGGKMPREALFFVTPSFYEQYGVEVLLGKRAEQVDADNRVVHLADGTRVSYDNLLVATGSRAKRLGVPGDDLPGVFTLKTLGDADRIVAWQEKIRDAVIVGGGLIGLQTAHALHQEGRTVSFVIGSDYCLSQNVDFECGSVVSGDLTSCGMQMSFQCGVASIEPRGGRLRVLLDGGDWLEADAVFVGKGVEANVSLVAGSGVEIRRGIVVDETMRTNIPGVFAAGDVAEGPNLITGEHQLVATWTNACEQGRTAGINMAGGEARYFSLGGNICSYQGRVVATLGLTKASNDEKYEEYVHRDDDRVIYRKLISTRRGEIVGATFLGAVDDIGIVQHLIRMRVALSPERLAEMARSPMRYGDFLFALRSFQRGRL